MSRKQFKEEKKFFSLAIQGVVELQKSSAYGNNKGVQRVVCKKNYSHSFTKVCFTAEN